jgi:L-lysine 2,3-aminomutase
MPDYDSHSVAGAAEIEPIRGNRVFTHPDQMTYLVHGLTRDRLHEAAAVALTYRFRLPEFYLNNVLNGRDDDPLLDLVFPSIEEMDDGPELWDATPSDYRASSSPYWIQKYQYQGLIRLTTACSGLCRFCYLKQKNASPDFMTVEDVNKVFDDLERNGKDLLEIILSGGDPFCAPADTLKQVGLRLERLQARLGRPSPHITIHTREPVWNPEQLLKRAEVLAALPLLKPKTIIINVLHPREVTRPFLQACSVIADATGAAARPALLCQHPLFKGVNHSVEVLVELYEALLGCSTPILPYYLVHPFYNGTLKKHRLGILESQLLYRELVRRPGCMVPKLVVPTPWGKCIVGPHEELQRILEGFLLTTKDGRRVIVR